MFRFSVLAAMMLSTACFASSCSSDDNGVTAPEKKGQITITPTTLTASADAQQVKFTVSADVDWSVASDESWVSLFPWGGLKNTPSDIKVTITANTGMEPRTAKIYVRAGSLQEVFTLVQNPEQKLNLSTPEYRVGPGEQTLDIKVEANTDWTAKADVPWLSVATATGSGDGACKVNVSANSDDGDRTGHITFAYADRTAQATVVQLTDAIDIPEGYQLVWNDEFNDDNASLSSLWSYDVKAPGWVNNERQRYVAGEINGIKTAEIHDGMLTITAQKVGNEVVSARLNSKQGWTYGIFEARLSLPTGKGTWPAFWMYPSRPDGNWPYCGEIDIMEEVGCVPNEVSSSIHCQAYNHPKNTQKTAKRVINGAEGDFHVYRLEWTEDLIRTFVDGQELFRFPNDKRGNRDTWPYDYDFKIILNLAWGGDWGGMWGVDENALPVKYDIDYVRVFQKK